MLIGRNLQNLWYIHTTGRALTAVLRLVEISLKEVSLQTAQQPEAMKESAVTWAFMWVGYTQKGYYEFSFGCHWISLFFCSCAPHLLRAEASKL